MIAPWADTVFVDPAAAQEGGGGGRGQPQPGVPDEEGDGVGRGEAGAGAGAGEAARCLTFVTNKTFQHWL